MYIIIIIGAIFLVIVSIIISAIIYGILKLFRLNNKIKKEKTKKYTATFSIFVLLFVLGMFFAIIDINNDIKLEKVPAEVQSLGEGGLFGGSYANVKYNFKGKTYYNNIEYKSFGILKNEYTHELKDDEKIVVYFENPDMLLSPNSFEYIYLPCFLISIICFSISIIKRKEAKENKKMLNISIGIVIIQIILLILSVVTGSIHILNKIIY